MTRSTKRCLHCRLKLRRVSGRWLHETLEDASACAAERDRIAASAAKGHA